MRRQLILLMSSTLLSVGCCREPHIEPSLPTESMGWIRQERKGVVIEAKLLLHQGEATRNDKIEVRVLDIIPGDACSEAGTYLRSPSAKMQFIRVSDNHVLCESRFYESSSWTLSKPKCSESTDELGLAGVFITDINLRDGWVFFQLHGLRQSIAVL